MDLQITKIYRGWTVSIWAAEKLCSKYSFSITDPAGNTQHVTLGGENEHRAYERATEMIDMEIAFAENE